MVKNKKFKSSKGTLIKGMSGNLPSEILDDPVFRDKLKKIMRGQSGIYALYKRDKLYYVGLSGDLHWRVRHHTGWDHHAGKWDSFRIFLIQQKFIKDVETLVQNIIKPKGNKVRGKVPHGSNLNYVLREVFKEHEKGLGLLKKYFK